MRLLRLLPLLAVALVLASCGGDDEAGPGEARAPATTSTATVPSTTAPPPTPEPEPEPERPLIAIGEQGSAMFTDPRFTSLGITSARRVVPWDTTDVDFERDLVDTWIGAARAAGVEPFVTFGHSRVEPEKLPSVAEFREAFRAFRERYPDVQVYAPWNEINHSSQPTDDEPRRAAEYYNVVRAECDGCTVLAGDLLDEADMLDYLAEYRRHLDGEPEIWGLHNYADSNRFRTSGLRSLLGAVEGDIWLTETGGIVRFGSNFPESERRAARATRYVLDLAERRERVARVYLYNWTGSPPEDRFDAGLIGPDNEPRPAYDVLKEELESG